MTIQFPGKEKLLHLYRERGLSQAVLARRYACTRGKIRYWLDNAKTDDPLRYGSRCCVRIVRDPSGLFNPGAEFRMSELALGARTHQADDTIIYADGENTITRRADEGIVWAEGTVFAIGRPGQEVHATCTDGVIVCEDGRVMIPNSSGGVEWENVETCQDGVKAEKQAET